MWRDIGSWQVVLTFEIDARTGREPVPFFQKVSTGSNKPLAEGGIKKYHVVTGVTGTTLQKLFCGQMYDCGIITG